MRGEGRRGRRGGKEDHSAGAECAIRNGGDAVMVVLQRTNSPKMLLHNHHHHLSMQYGKQLLLTVKLQPVCFYVTSITTFFFFACCAGHTIFKAPCCCCWYPDMLQQLVIQENGSKSFDICLARDGFQDHVNTGRSIFTQHLLHHHHAHSRLKAYKKRLQTLIQAWRLNHSIYTNT